MGWREWIRTVEIAAAVTAADPALRASQVEALLRTGARIFHFEDDPELVGALAPLVHRYEGAVDVVVSRAGRAHLLAAAGADSITLPLTAAGDASVVRELGLQVGLALGPDDRVADVAAAAAEGIDLVFVAGPPDERLVALRAALPAGVAIEVEDASYENAGALHRAGATVLVAGEPIFAREDLPRAYRRLVQALA